MQGSGLVAVFAFHVCPLANFNHGFPFTHRKHITSKLGICKYWMNLEINSNRLAMCYVPKETSESRSSAVLKYVF